MKKRKTARKGRRRRKVKCPAVFGSVGNYAEDVARFVEAQGGWVRPDLKAQAEACQARIEAAGYTWDQSRGLWRIDNVSD